ncbi:MAG: bifunctional oligoribonuclease/PAP phosphatase NrnA [Patescibacteria group bacterium]|nr:bifunctional oligoribonuclease/PAP phosphatase NrnA [Patescibacteria group bacterium]
MLETQEQIINLIEKSNSILLLPSAPPDGDSLGSSLALYLALKKLGKEATVICSEPIPDAFSFLPTIETISADFGGAEDFIVTLDCKNAEVDTIKYEVEQNKVNIIVTPKHGNFSEKDVSVNHGPSKYDLIITVDTGDLQQLGTVYEQNPEMFYSIPVINIDHHASNSEFGRINLVDMTASSTTEMLLPLLEKMEQKTGRQILDPDIATLLLAGIITDTGSFQHANTTPRALAVSASLLDLGARQQEIIKYIYKTKSLSMLKLWGHVLSKIKYDEQNCIVWSTITLEDFQETGSKPDETAGIIDELLSNAPGAQIVMILKEKKQGLVSGSLRTPNKGANANEIAKLFGGGGHQKAAGFRIYDMNFHEAEGYVLQKIREYQSEGGGAIDQPHMQPAKIEVPPQIQATPEEHHPKTAQELRSDPLANVQVQKPEPVPAAQPGGEDMLLSHFRKQVQEEKDDGDREGRIKDMTKQFFEKEEGTTVEDVLNQAPVEYYRLDDDESTQSE